MTSVYFRPKDKSIPNLLLTSQHKRLWQLYGEQIIEGLKNVTGCTYLQGIRIEVGILTPKGNGYLEWSHNGITGKEAMALYYESAYCSEVEILWQLCHELGHRLIGQHKLAIDPTQFSLSRWEENYETHRDLFVFLVDVFMIAFKNKLADQIINYGNSRYTGEDNDPYRKSYEDSWVWANSLTRARRHELTRLLFEQNKLILPKN
jgi:hypothetical protein